MVNPFTGITAPKPELRTIGEDYVYIDDIKNSVATKDGAEAFFKKGIEHEIDPCQMYFHLRGKNIFDVDDEPYLVEVEMLVDELTGTYVYLRGYDIDVHDPTRRHKLGLPCNYLEGRFDCKPWIDSHLVRGHPPWVSRLPDPHGQMKRVQQQRIYDYKHKFD